MIGFDGISYLRCCELLMWWVQPTTSVCLVEEIGNIYIFVHQVYFSRLDMYVYWVEAWGNLDQCIRACSSLNVCIINMRVTHILLAFFMITSSMETFSALMGLLWGEPPATGEFPSQRTVTRGFDDFFDVRLNKRLGWQSTWPWLNAPWRSLWCHFNDGIIVQIRYFTADVSRTLTIRRGFKVMTSSSENIHFYSVYFVYLIPLSYISLYENTYLYY